MILASPENKKIQINLQKEVICTQKQPGCKKGVAPFKMASVKKVLKSKGVAKKWL